MINLLINDDKIMLINGILITAGAILMICTLAGCKELIFEIKFPALRKPWLIAHYLVIFFILGYLIYLYLVISALVKINLATYLVSFIFFFGAVFVNLVLKIANELTKKLNQQADELARINQVLMNENTTLKDAQNQLKQMIEGFYALPLVKKSNGHDQAAASKTQK